MEKEIVEKYSQRMLRIIKTVNRPPKDANLLGYGQGQRRILLHLANNKDGVTSGELSSELDVGTGRIGNALKELEKKNFIRRLEDKKDKRKVLVVPTKKGLDYVETMKEDFYKGISETVEEMGEEKFGQLLDLLEEFLAYKIKKSGKEKDVLAL